MNGPARGGASGPPVVVLLHGFTREPRHLSGLAEACGQHGWTTVRPALAPPWLPVLMNSAGHLNRVADRLDARLADRAVIVVGHSAGAAAGAWLAARWAGRGREVRGLVLVDGNDSPNHLLERAWPGLEGVPVRAVLAPPGPCNRDGRLELFLAEHRPGVAVVVPGSGHGDIEGSPSAVYRWACRDDSDAAVRSLVRDEVLVAIGALGAGGSGSMSG